MSMEVIKFGGAAMKDPALVDICANEIAQAALAGREIVVVHGGGPEVDAMLARLGLKSERVAGLRVTDAPAMEIVEMVLAGKVNKSLASKISSNGAPAIGLSGRDAGLLRVKKKIIAEGDLGFVGEVVQVNSSLLIKLAKERNIPVLCSIGEDSSGIPYNVNADDVAAAVAIALEAESLTLFTDVPGVLARYPDPTSLIERLILNQVDELIDNGTIAGGMIPKVKSCVDVVKRGVKAVRIIDGRSQSTLSGAIRGSSGSGTVISA